MMSERPRIKLKLTLADMVIEGMALAALIVVWVLTALYYPDLQEIIPTHFDASGEVNGYGSKSMLLLLPAISTVLYVGLTILNRFPHIMNYPIEITEENAERQYYNVTRFMRFMKLVVIMVFGLILYKTQETVSGNSEGLDKWFLPLTLGSVFIPIVFYLMKAFREK